MLIAGPTTTKDDDDMTTKKLNDEATRDHKIVANYFRRIANDQGVSEQGTWEAWNAWERLDGTLRARGYLPAPWIHARNPDRS